MEEEKRAAADLLKEREVEAGKIAHYLLYARRMYSAHTFYYMRTLFI